jgi:hypothetical protein
MSVARSTPFRCRPEADSRIMPLRGVVEKAGPGLPSPGTVWAVEELRPQLSEVPVEAHQVLPDLVITPDVLPPPGRGLVLASGIEAGSMASRSPWSSAAIQCLTIEQGSAPPLHRSRLNPISVDI